MRFPGNSIGVSDILQYRDCPARFEFGMRRHSPPEHVQDKSAWDSPESWSPANAYGSAIHHAIHLTDQGSTEDEAIQEAWRLYGRFLEPSDVQRLRDDLNVYLSRDVHGVRTLISEHDASIPLFTHNGETIFFRFKLDRLYQRLDNEAAFIHVDYKSSKWQLTEEQVHRLIQLWAYNFGIYELYPECEDLQQLHDQLTFGQTLTRKSDRQREQIKEWLIREATIMLEDETMAPQFNEWCPWCPIKMDCPVVQHELTDFAQARIAALMPREPKKKKDGSDSKVLAPWMPDAERFDEYVELLPKVARAKRTLEAFEENVKEALGKMPDTSLDRLTYRKRTVPTRRFTADVKQRIHERVGAAFYSMVELSIAGVERFYGKDDDEAKEKVAAITDEAVQETGYTVVERIPE